MMFTVRPVTVISMLVAVLTAHADRAPVDRGTAQFILEGVVESVEKSEDGEHDWYLVRIKVTKVEKGKGVKAGEVFKATCYRLARPRPKSFASRGHDDVPIKGDRIKAFLSNHNTHGGYEGVYPEWCDLLGRELPPKK